MATEQPQDIRDSVDVKPLNGSRTRAAAPREVITLHDLDEIHALWGVGHERIYAAVARGQLRAYGRPGRQKFYSEAELIALLGPKRFGPSDGPAKLSASDNGRNQQGSLFEHLRAA